ncbi:Adenosine monophosphate-protein transferase SoFic [Limihaloglobus sulfuriphilus]|uniref:Adenosine monophosphate-protein transferase SoFic n=1 Tax=Limihaloglobus sulfuriphilus TaxID=1851148 RepID=A0A1Q2MHX6_9BACT|nr:Fic family protein [Limihaloglobus sulfuriphilus]AQQ72128.1 Adenosine monophosphate-protein transferase SoFic [Limihaloglobus sulfuriphilus]
MINTETVVITDEILKYISEIDEFKGKWSALGRLSPQRISALLRVATIESIASSTRIEGCRLTDTQVEALLQNLSAGSFLSRDEQEVAGYATVMETVFESYQCINITENVIKQFHRDLLQYSDKDTRHRGEYKKTSNSVEAFDTEGESLGIIFKTAAPFDTPRLMKELLDWYNEELKLAKMHPLLITAIFAVVFLEIHPFQDGNGRLSRILSTLMLLKFGYSYVPYSSMESIIEQNKDNYYLALRRSQQTIRTDTPDWQPWILFFLQSAHSQKNHLQMKLERERIFIAAMPELSLQIIEIIKSHGRCSVKNLSEVTGRSRNTIKHHLSRLVETEQIVKHGAGRGTWYSIV